MKKEYPNYRSSGVQFIEDNLKPKEKKILEKFLTYCSITAGDKKVRETRISILQVRDVIQKDFDEITLEDVREFLAILNQGYQKDWTKQGVKITFQKFLKWNYRDWSDRFDNLKDIRFGKISTQEKYNDTTLLTDEDTKKLINVCQGYRDKSLISLKIETAGRPEEIRKLKFKDFNEDYTEVTLFSGKKKESRTLPCDNSSIFIKKWFNSYSYPDVRKEDYLFPSPNNREKILTSNAEWHLIKRTAERAGIKKNVYGYLLRHSKLNELYKKLPIQIHRKFAGHSRDSSMTAIYDHTNNEEMIEAIRKLKDVENMPEERKHELEKQIKELQENQEALLNTIDLVVDVINQDRKITGIQKKQMEKAKAIIMKRGLSAPLTDIK